MNDNSYTSRECYLREQVKKYGQLMMIYTIMYIIEALGAVFVSIATFIHWFGNDSLTRMQLFKWSLNHYWFIYAFIIFMIFFKFKIQEDNSTYKSFQQQLIFEIHKRETAQKIKEMKQS